VGYFNLIRKAASTVLVLGALVAFAETPQPVHASSEELINFSLLDYKGKNHELRRTDARAIVLFFTETGCPVARQSIDKLKSLREHYSDKGVVIWMIDSNAGDDRAAVEKEAREFNESPLPVLIDDTQEIARLLNVKRTAETICIDTTNWTVFYRGAIDDQLVEGAQKPQPTQKYVENALDEFLSGKAIAKSSSVGRGCLLTFEPSGPDASKPVSYTHEIAPMLREKCVTCHSPGNIAPFVMSSYQKVHGRADMIREVLVARRMPPWDADPHFGHFKNDRSLTLAQQRTLLRWIDQGAPQDDGPDPLAEATPEPAKWPLGEPDYIIKLPVAEQIPATGILDYRYVEVPSPVTNNVWLAGAVFRPGNRRVVHHLIVRAKYEKPPKEAKDDAFLTAWAPGIDYWAYPEGTGKFLGAGATLNFELHYTADGKPETDQSELGLYVMKSPPKLPLQTTGAYNSELVVPPHEPEAPSAAIFGFDHDTIIYDFAPHMHLRGSWFRYEALYPNGKRETLLSVPRYDFAWQTIYRLSEPKTVPAGTWIYCTGGFDNSTLNPANPNPDRRIHWGDQSFDEMFIGFMDVARLPSKKGAAHKEEADNGSAKDPVTLLSE
jgi:peroxiredoxin